MPAAITNGTGSDHAPFALLTKTVTRSPVVRWILPARLRHRSLNDVAYVGEDFIEVKQVKRGGHVEQIISKHDFGSRIRSAQVFTIDDPTIATEEDVLPMRYEFDFSNTTLPIIPAQLLVLCLAAPIVMFLYITRDEYGYPTFRYQVVETPRWPNPLQQTGGLLSIDPHSRAMAVASRGGKIILYAAKDKEMFKNELVSGTPDWCPVTQERIIENEAPISHMAFLQPQRQDIDHVYLLFVVTDTHTRRTRLNWIDWRVSLGIMKLQTHEQIPLDAPRCVPTLLVPLCNTNFLLIYDGSIRFYKNLLSGTPTLIITDNIGENFPPMQPGLSPKRPLWVNWCRPSRLLNALQDKDFIYLCREDGQVFLVMIQQDGNMHASCAGDLECHVGEAFASLGDDMDPDLLAVAADMSIGRIVSIGTWSSPRAVGRSRQETMNMKLLEKIPNWASVTDLAVARIQTSHSRASRPRDSVFLTSGRQPYGQITEIRHGLEARMLSYFPLPDLRNTLGVWALPDPPTGAIILLLTTPDSTVVWLVEGTVNGIEISSGMGSFSELERTLAAGVFHGNQLIQVTTRRIVVTGSLRAGFEDKEELVFDENTYCDCAVLAEVLGLIVTCEQSPSGWTLRARPCLTAADSDVLISSGPVIQIDYEVLCMACTSWKEQALVVVSSAAGEIHAYLCDNKSITHQNSFNLGIDNAVSCDQMVLLQSARHDLVVVCGMRNGQLVTIGLNFSSGLTTDSIRTIPFGKSTVKLTRSADENACAYAMCGTDTCLVRLNALEPQSVNIESIWATDKNRPALPQSQIFGCTRLPHPDALSQEGGLNSFGNSLIMICSDEAWVTLLGRDRTVVPRQIDVKGTPFRLTYTQAQRSLVCASIVTETTEHDKRRCYPHIDFVDPKSGGVTAKYDLEPDEEVFCLLEWSPESQERKKSYLFVLVGGKYLKHGNQKDVRGRVRFLRWQKDNQCTAAEPVDAVVLYALTLDAPVYAMALFDELTFVVCYGRAIRLYRFSFDDRKVYPICEPLMLSSSAASVSCQGSNIFVTTRADSMVALRVDAQEQTNGASSVESYRLHTVSTGPRADVGVSHAVLSLDGTSLANNGAVSDLVLMTTTHRQVIGLAVQTSQTHSISASIGFEAILPQSVTKVRRCDVRPAWRPHSSQSVIDDGFIGCCADGSLVGMAVIDESLWRRLFWLQRLCEWDALMSPHTYERPAYTVANADMRGFDRALPIGLSMSADITLSTPHSYDGMARAMHIDGDVLARLLYRGGAPPLRSMIEKASMRADHVGEWLKNHLDEELAAVDSCITELRTLLDSWL